MKYDKNVSFWYFCSWNLQINSFRTILNLECFAQNFHNLLDFHYLTFQSLLPNFACKHHWDFACHNLWRVFDNFGKVCIFHFEEREKRVNWVGTVSGLNSEEPPSQIYCSGLEDMKVRMTLSWGSQDCFWREDLGITIYDK